jgi:mannose-6-phosphate isomerase-like protein (cupin superfamily)
MLTTAVLLVGLTIAQLPAEKPPQPQPPAPAKPPVQTAPAPRQPVARPSISVLVTDRQGRPLTDVAVKATGPMEREGKTDTEGAVLLRNVAAGTYRLRFESPGTITFEREVTVAAGRPVKTTVELTAAPPPPPPPPPRPEPPPQPIALPPPVRPSGPPSSVAIPDFVEKNYIGRGQPSKSSPVGCTGTSTATLLQLRDPLAEHSHADADEMLYVVAGEGVERIGGIEMKLSPGTFAVVPKGTPHTITRRGSTPLIAISILTGPPCDSAK